MHVFEGFGSSLRFSTSFGERGVDEFSPQIHRPSIIFFFKLGPSGLAVRVSTGPGGTLWLLSRLFALEVPEAQRLLYSFWSKYRKRLVTPG